MDKSGVRHWVLVETGANQAYVFGTNRLRHVVGASHLIHQAGTDWAPAAAERHGASVVLAISGKSLLLVDDPATGRAVINDVSLRALQETPGLEVTGAVGPAIVYPYFYALRRDCVCNVAYRVADGIPGERRVSIRLAA